MDIVLILCFRGEDSMREISVKYNVKKSTLSRLLQSDPLSFVEKYQFVFFFSTMFP